MKKLMILAVFLAAPAYADVVGPGGKIIECFCTDKTGSRVELGQTICMDVGGCRFTARCEMMLNNPMWRETEEGCVSSSLIERFQNLKPTANAGLVYSKI